MHCISASVRALRLRVAILFLPFALVPMAVAAAAHTSKQNPQPAAAASRQASAPATSASPRKRAGRTPVDDLMDRFRLSLGKNASTAHVKPHDQVSFTIPQFFTAPQFASSGVDQFNIYASAEGDFNGDGIADLATLNEDGGLNIFLNTGNGVMKYTYFDGSLTAAVLQHNMLQMVTGDLNGDGFADIIALDQGANQFEVWLSKGDGTLSAPMAYSVQPKSGADFSLGGGIALADVNSDGHLDLVALSRPSPP